MADETTRPDRTAAHARADRHRPHLPPVPEASLVAPDGDAPPAAAGPRGPARTARAPRPVTPVLDDQTRGGLRRPAQISDRCAGCGAPTRGRTLMVTELVEVGPVRALRVVACSECSDRRRRELMP